MTTKASRTWPRRRRGLKTRTKVQFQFPRLDEEEAKIQLQASRPCELQTLKLEVLKYLLEEAAEDAVSSQLRCVETTNQSRKRAQRRAPARAWLPHVEEAVEEEEDDLH